MCIEHRRVVGEVVHGACHYHFAVAAEADVVCSPSVSQGTASVMSDGEGVDYHQNESVWKCNNSCADQDVVLVMSGLLY